MPSTHAWAQALTAAAAALLTVNLLPQSFHYLFHQLPIKLLQQLGGGVVLTGGGAYLKNVAQLAEKVFGLPCEIGVPRNVSGLTANLAVPEYAAGVGAVLCGYKSMRLKAEQKKSVWKKLGNWFGVG